jgi:hypothetical protein
MKRRHKVCVNFRIVCVSSVEDGKRVTEEGDKENTVLLFKEGRLLLYQLYPICVQLQGIIIST